MGGLVFRSNGRNISFKDPIYTNGKYSGTRHLCLRTGTGSNDVVKYGLTSNRSASVYCPMKLRVDGKDAYIGKISTSERKVVTTSSTSSIYSTVTWESGGIFTTSYPGKTTSVFSRTWVGQSSTNSHTIPARDSNGQTCEITSYDYVTVVNTYTYTAETGDGIYTTCTQSWHGTSSSESYVSENILTGTRSTSYYSMGNINM